MKLPTRACVLAVIPIAGVVRADPPVNDLCENATVVTGPGPHAFNNAEATAGIEEHALCCTLFTCRIAHDVWFRWTATCSGLARLTTCGVTLDTEIAVYRAPCPGSDLTILACNDDWCGLQSIAAWSAIAGQQYLFRIGTFPGSPGGAGTFRIICGICPCDFTADGVLNSQDFFDFLDCFFTDSCPEADINSDGRVDSQDFFDFLTCFFTPPGACQ